MNLIESAYPEPLPSQPTQVDPVIISQEKDLKNVEIDLRTKQLEE